MTNVCLHVDLHLLFPKCIRLGLFTGIDVPAAPCHNTKSLSSVLTITRKVSYAIVHMFKTEIS